MLRLQRVVKAGGRNSRPPRPTVCGALSSYYKVPCEKGYDCRPLPPPNTNRAQAGFTMLVLEVVS